MKWNGEEEKRGLSKISGKFLPVFFVVKLADWLQGTNMYTLYVSYGVNAGLLFTAGFCCSAISATFVGSFVDKYGRKNACLVYCALEIMIQVLEHVPNFHVLLLGRILGGISTSLLFSAFESWLLSEHDSENLSDHELEEIFSATSKMNGLAAILAGFLAKIGHSISGDLGPFQISLALTMLAAGMIKFSWKENFGHGSFEVAHDRRIEKLAVTKAILKIGVLQTIFEGATYIFVFTWVPSILVSAKSETRPSTELIFSSLMIALSLGGALFEKLSSDLNRLLVGKLLFFIAACSQMLSSFALQTDVNLLMLSFCVFEMCVGAFDPWISAFRSKHLLKGQEGRLLSQLRVPVNILVFCGVQLADQASLKQVFQTCALMNVVPLGLLFI